MSGLWCLVTRQERKGMITDTTTPCENCPDNYAESEFQGHKLCFRCVQNVYKVMEQFAIKITNKEL